MTCKVYHPRPLLSSPILIPRFPVYIATYTLPYNPQIKKKIKEWVQDSYFARPEKITKKNKYFNMKFYIQHWFSVLKRRVYSYVKALLCDYFLGGSGGFKARTVECSVYVSRPQKIIKIIQKKCLKNFLSPNYVFTSHLKKPKNY